MNEVDPIGHNYGLSVTRIKPHLNHGIKGKYTPTFANSCRVSKVRRHERQHQCKQFNLTKMTVKQNKIVAIPESDPNNDTETVAILRYIQFGEEMLDSSHSLYLVLNISTSITTPHLLILFIINRQMIIAKFSECKYFSIEATVEVK